MAMRRARLGAAHVAVTLVCMYHASHIDSITLIDAADWNALTTTTQPFCRHGFLAALESGDSASAQHGWWPWHLLLHDDAGQLVAAAPLYVKSHSFGEFVFDFAWANAYRQLGVSYYPKLVNAIPFAPVVGPRLLARDHSARAALARHLTTLADGQRYSSLHTLFADASSRDTLSQAGASLRRDCHYRWYNRGYHS